MKRIAFYGGSFDPLHIGHLKIAGELAALFHLDSFVFIPAFHAPHKKGKNPTSAFHRYAMLASATANIPNVFVSKMELESPDEPFTIETLEKLKREFAEDKLFFVIGADSWREITTWREWENVLTIVNLIVVTRPGFDIEFSHVTENIRERIVDLRGGERFEDSDSDQIYLTDRVNLEISATEIRRKIGANDSNWRNNLTDEVANYIEKYDLYI